MIIAPHTSLSAERLTMGVFATLLTMSISAQLTVDLTASTITVSISRASARRMGALMRP